MFYFGNYKLRVVLGEACNMHCAYCGQCANPNKDKPREVSENFLSYLKWLNSTYPDKTIQIQFFGGEPLLYWDKVQAIMEYAENLPNSIYTYMVTTNGLLLDKAKIDYCNEHNISICLSWDGHNSINTRYYDVIKEKGDLIYKINSLCISAVITARAYIYDVFRDIQDVVNAYRAKTGRDVFTNAIYMSDLNYSKELNTFDYGKLREQYHKIFDVYREFLSMEGDNSEFFTKHNIILGYANLFLQTIRQEIESDNKYSHCELVIGALPIDLDGNIYTCSQVMDKPLGNVITDSSKKLMHAYAESEYRIMHRRNTMCKDCEAHPFCRGGCKLIKDEDMASTCELWRNIMSALQDEIKLTLE